MNYSSIGHLIKTGAFWLFGIGCITIPMAALGLTLVKLDAIIITTENQKYDFVMRPSMLQAGMPGEAKPPLAQSGEMILNFPKNHKGREILDPHRFNSISIASEYPASGLYDHGSKVPIWTVDWHEVDVVVAEDGHHLSRLAWNYGSDLNHPAIIFYEDGKEIRSWSMRELVDNNPLCLLKEGWYFGLDLENHSGDEIRISTRRGQTVILSLLTGEMIERTISQCPLEFPRIPELGLWSTTIQDPQASIELDEDHKTNYGVLLSFALGIVIILLQTRTAHKERNRSDD
jgi:hypothetical protein